MSSLPKCYFNYNTLKAKVGNIHKGYEELNCLKVPTFTKTKLERSDEGNGWYGAKEKVTYTHNDWFIIMKDNKPFGILMSPYIQETIKSDIHPLNTKKLHYIVKNFINQLTKAQNK